MAESQRSKSGPADSAVEATADTVSFAGDEGERVADILLRLSLGQISIREAGPGFFSGPGGAIGIRVDEETFRAFKGEE